MRPLREELDSSDAALARAARLLSSEIALVASADHRQRLFEGVQRARPRPSALSLVARWAMSPLGALVIVATTAIVAAVLAAARARSADHGGRPDGKAASRSPTAVAGGRPAAAAAAAPPSSATASPAPLPAAVASGAPWARRRSAARPISAPASPPASAPASMLAGEAHASEEALLVRAALLALRQGHDPERAAVLLDDYLERHAHGALHEEALALAIEAALANHDARAAELARRYLRLFPAGLYRATAEGALGGSSP